MSKLKSRQNLLINKGIKYHDLQIDAITNIYAKIKRLNSSTNNLKNSSSDENDINNRIYRWIDSYNELSNYYSENDIILDIEISNLIDSYIKLHDIIFSQFINHKRILQEKINELGSEFPDKEYERYTRDRLQESAIELEKSINIFEDKNSNILKKLQLLFTNIINPSNNEY